MIVISGSSNPLLSQQVALKLDAARADVHISKFPNGEKRIWVKTDVTDQTVVIIQSFSAPVDEHIIELTLLADACRHRGAKKIVAVIPWMGYSPQDKSFREGEPVSVHVISRIIEAVGVSEVITLDIHSQKSLDFFTIPVKEITCLPIFESYLKKQSLANYVVVDIDKGSRKRSEEFSKALGLPLCVFDKKRDRFSGAVTLSHISGDVEGKTAVSFDDFVSTGATQIGACDQLKAMGLKKYIACITHAVFAGTDTSHKLQDSQIDEILTTDTYAIPPARNFIKLEVLSVADLITEAIKDYR